MMTDIDRWYHARDDLQARVVEDLMGPAAPVSLQEPPLNRIIVGVLHPTSADGQTPTYKEGLADEESDQTVEGAGADDAPDPPVALSHAKNPSSMGMTFAVNPDDSPTVELTISARRFIDQGDGSWNAADITATVQIPTRSKRITRDQSPVHDGLALHFVVRPRQHGASRITVALINTTPTPADGAIDGACWFRPKIAATAGEFVERKPPTDSTIGDFDRRSAAFLYRHHPAIAVGHGCAVSWIDSSPVVSVETTFFPTHDVLLADPNGGSAGNPFGEYELFMDDLAKPDFDVSPLHAMADAYESWIAEQERRRDSMTGANKDTAGEHLALARECGERIRSGIEALSRDEVREAFRLMNQAMVAQRDAQDRARGNSTVRQRWRPFQIAFILINLPALADSTHSDRDVADLLWFPTGGGKTEAYLGCIAFTILLRRIRKQAGDIKDDSGVTAIMRYTLRLLTRQQFERAAGLICGLELIRRRHLPGTSEISLGLWVGKTTSPNTLKTAKPALDKLRAGLPAGDANPVQILECPWCGTTLTPQHYSVEETMIIACGQSDCEFGGGLPLYLIDDDVYAKRPTLLIGTVDKFAQMTWRAEVSSLIPTGPDLLPPELIIQDELHLISGPLGTIVGLYEAALDLACSVGGRPKVLASTATIRQATQQVRAVFDRQSRQFPPPGLVPDDNYFARPAPPSSKGSRRYVGILAPGTSQTTLLVRIYAATLQGAAEMEVDDEVRDAYWSLLGYFNSLRVLSSTYLQVLDDIPKRIEVLARRSSLPQRHISQEPVELTSRINQTQIPGAMKKLEEAYPKSESADVVLATNMISVGLDIDRLGLMVVAGQPQSTSEYIQATSRIGRRHPGLVLVSLNGNRSRDKSHYESFVPFHRALYREVEATSATPFASRARDRGAHGVLVAAIRLLIPALQADRSAPEIGKHLDAVQSIIAKLVDRCASVSDEQSSSDVAAFAEQLRKLVDDWEDAVAHDRIDSYGKMTPARARRSRNTTDRPLLITADSGQLSPRSYPVEAPPWPTLTSMRDVDAETSLFVTRLNPGKDQGNGQ